MSSIDVCLILGLCVLKEAIDPNLSNEVHMITPQCVCLLPFLVWRGWIGQSSCCVWTLGCWGRDRDPEEDDPPPPPAYIPDTGRTLGSECNYQISSG